MPTVSAMVDLDRFKEQGYFLAKGLLDPDRDLKPVKEEYSALLDSLAERWHAKGRLTSTYRGLPFGDRICKITAEGQDWMRHFDISLPVDATLDTPIHLGPAAFNLLRNPRVLDVLEELIGPEIYSNPVQHIRIKPPEHAVPAPLLNGLTGAVGWHQDLGVVGNEADETQMISVWIAITDAGIENGCLQVVPGSHLGELALHCHYNERKGLPFKQLNIPDRFVGSRQVPMPMKAGDVLFFHKKMMHSSLPNVSDTIRWSFDLRYNPIGQATGRPWLPGFVARSRSHPELELKDPERWAQLWLETRTRLASGKGIMPSSRWSSDHPLCA